MHDLFGVLAAAASSSLGGISGGATRYVIAATDPVTLGVFRYGIGFLILFVIALALRRRWPAREDWLATAALGILFFFAFSVLFNLAYSMTTAARGALALSTMPIQTMLVAAALGVEKMTWRKSLGVLIAMGGVALALAGGLQHAPQGAWRGEVVMLLATFCMSLFNVWSRPFIARSDPLTYITFGMGAAAVLLFVWALLIGGFAVVSSFGTGQWIAVTYLATFGSAAIFFLWSYALGRTTPTKAAVTITVNPVFAAIVGALAINEPIGINLLIGVAAVLAGILIAATGKPTTK
jgi:drug/metabolite transporter (DMT)-like permease